MILTKHCKTNSPTNNITIKSNNREPIRVLYKKAGKTPEVKIINDILKLKKAIVERHLEIIPYENVFIICNDKKEMQNMKLNVVFNLYHISGDLILLKIDKKRREFQSLSQEDILWYSNDLINKMPFTESTSINKYYKPKTIKSPNFYDRDIEEDTSGKKQVTFENTLINILVNIELLLAKVSKDLTIEGSEDNEDEYE